MHARRRFEVGPGREHAHPVHTQRGRLGDRRRFEAVQVHARFGGLRGRGRGEQRRRVPAAEPANRPAAISAASDGRASDGRVRARSVERRIKALDLSAEATRSLG